jgi:hypothetical protein
MATLLANRETRGDDGSIDLKLFCACLPATGLALTATAWTVAA